jgi:hypothetical protein
MRLRTRTRVAAVAATAVPIALRSARVAIGALLFSAVLAAAVLVIAPPAVTGWFGIATSIMTTVSSVVGLFLPLCVSRCRLNNNEVINFFLFSGGPVWLCGKLVEGLELGVHLWVANVVPIARKVGKLHGVRVGGLLGTTRITSRTGCCGARLLFPLLRPIVLTKIVKHIFEGKGGWLKEFLMLFLELRDI